MSFSNLGFDATMLRVVDAVRYTVPTPIQHQSIPLILEGNDLIAQAQTGTGKTAAFVLPILQILKDMPPNTNASSARVLVLAPTRELAQQVTQVFERFGQYTTREVRAISIIGGVDIGGQINQLRGGIEIVVATPGRLLELIREEKISFSELRFLVIDEADKLLDLGFAEELDLLIKALPATRQNLLFSATYPEKVMQLTEQVMQNPLHIDVTGPEPTLSSIMQRVIEVNRSNRGPLLRHLIKEEQWKHVLIFVASKRAARNLTAKLQRNGIKADAFHGDLDQEQRIWVLNQFKNRNIDILIATDIAARGIDIEGLSMVVNYDLPRSPADYIHRIGRTGRAGLKGIAISLIGHEDQAHFFLIEKRTKLQLDREQIAGFELTGEAPQREKGAPPVKGKRPNKKDKARAAQNQKDKI
ncbi:MAG: DEAD/DEAH box helicase [Pontiella sp.]